MRLDYLLLGYRKVSPREGSLAGAVTALISGGLTARVNKNGEFLIPEYRYKKYKAALDNLECEISDTKGLFGFLKSNRKRYGVIAGIIFCIVFTAFSGTRIWDVRIEGNEVLSDAYIEHQLEKMGVYRGVGWGSFDSTEKQTQILTECRELAWISINRRGTVAYVTVREKSQTEEPADGKIYSNIVSAYDCIIEEITVSSGVAAVGVGDTVRAGDLLISGVIPAELGGGFVEAEGVVVGRLKEKVFVTAGRSECVKVSEKTEISEIRVKIFSFLLNIYKKYGNSDKNYAIIEEEVGVALFSKYKLPLKICKAYREYSTEKTVSYTDEQLVKIATERLKQGKMLAIGTGELIGAKTVGEFSEEGYSLRCDMTLLKSVGSTVVISADESEK